MGRRRLQRSDQQRYAPAALHDTGGMRERGRVPDEDKEFAAELQAALRAQSQQEHQRPRDGRGAPARQPAPGRGWDPFDARGVPQLERSHSGSMKLTDARWAAAKPRNSMAEDDSGPEGNGKVRADQATRPSCSDPALRAPSEQQ